MAKKKAYVYVKHVAWQGKFEGFQSATERNMLRDR